VTTHVADIDAINQKTQKASAAILAGEFDKFKIYTDDIRKAGPGGPIVSGLAGMIQ